MFEVRLHMLERIFNPRQALVSLCTGMQFTSLFCSELQYECRGNWYANDLINKFISEAIFFHFRRFFFY